MDCFVKTCHNYNAFKWSFLCKLLGKLWSRPQNKVGSDLENNSLPEFNRELYLITLFENAKTVMINLVLCLSTLGSVSNA